LGVTIKPSGSFSGKLSTSQRDLDAARVRRDDLASQLSTAEARIPELNQCAQTLAFEGNTGPPLDAAEGKIIAARLRIDTLSAALLKTNEQITAIETQLVALADAKMRAETAAEIEQRATRIEAAGKQIDAALAELVEASSSAGEAVLDAAGLTAFATNAKIEIQPTILMVARELRGRAKATLAGNAPAALIKAPLALVQPLLPSPPQLERYFTLWAVKYVDAAGAFRCVPQFSVVELRPDQARRGLASGDVCKTDDPRVARNRHSKTNTQQQPRPEHCHDLDGNSNVAYQPPAPVFQQVDRGPAYNLRIPVQPAVVARDADITTDQE
jgi:hypothetical protein